MNYAKLFLFLILSFCISTAFSQEMAVIGVPYTVTIKIPPPENMNSCNIEITLPNGEKVQKELGSPKFEDKLEFVPKLVGQNLLHWEGKIKFRGLKTALGCPGSGKLVVEVSYPKQALLSEKDIEQYQSAVRFFEEGRYSEAFPLFRLLAEKGSSESQAILAFQYHRGVGVERNFSEAFRWASLSSETEPLAMTVLGWLYFDGLGVQKNCDSAIKYFRAAVEKDSSRGMAALGYAYESGRCGVGNKSEAISLYTKAAELGDTGAMHRLGLAYEKGWGVTKDASLALTWVRRAADAGNEDAKNDLQRLERSEASAARDRQRLEAETLAMKQKEERDRLERESNERQRNAEEHRVKMVEQEKRESMVRAERARKEEAERIAKRGGAPGAGPSAAAGNTEKSKDSGASGSKSADVPPSAPKPKVRSVLDL